MCRRPLTTQLALWCHYCTHVQATTSGDRLLGAARKVLGEKGYDAATVREISTEAGVPQGLIHYYFGGKEGMLVELLRREALAYRAEQKRLATSEPDDRAAARAALDRRHKRVAKDPAWHRMRYELFALGLRNAALAPALRELLAIGRDGVQGLLERSHRTGGTDTKALAAVVLASMDGLALQKLADPDFDLDAGYKALERLLEGEVK